MIKTIMTSAAFVATATLALAADDDGVLPKEGAEFVKWGEESGWNIFIDKSRNACLIERVDENANVVQMGLTADKEFGYLGVFTQAEIEFDDDKVHLLLDEKPYVGDAYLAPSNLSKGYKGGYILANNPDFVEDVQRRYNMIVMPEHSNSFEVSLDGTLKAIDAARVCNDEAAAM